LPKGRNLFLLLCGSPISQSPLTFWWFILDFLLVWLISYHISRNSGYNSWKWSWLCFCFTVGLRWLCSCRMLVFWYDVLHFRGSDLFQENSNVSERKSNN
jgi:hypothetical protein